MRWMTLAGALTGATIALGAAACGGSEGTTSGAEKIVDSVAGSEQTDPGLGDPLTGLETELRDAGYRAGKTEVSEAQGALSAESPDGTELKIYYYAAAGEAKDASEEIEQVFADHPGHGLVEVRGGFVITVAEERRLNAAEKRALVEVTGLAEDMG